MHEHEGGDGDYDDPFSPNPDGERQLHCLHCGGSFNEQDVVYETRFGSTLWWCPTKNCSGAGVGMDLLEEGNNCSVVVE